MMVGLYSGFAERFRQFRAKLNPLNVKPVAQIVRVIYIGAHAASFDEVKADVSKQTGWRMYPSWRGTRRKKGGARGRA